MNPKKIALKVLRYLCILIPMSSLLIVPIYFYGDEFGLVLIDKFGDTTGLYIRPLVMVAIYIITLGILLYPKLEKLNEALWLKQLDYVEIKNIYKTYIYAISSFGLITLLVVLKTSFAYTADGINWFNTKDYLFIYLVVALCVSPFFVKKN